jgi:hypothetical protein
MNELDLGGDVAHVRDGPIKVLGRIPSIGEV